MTIPCEQPAFHHVFHPQSPDRQQPIKEPSLKYYPFLYFQLCENAIYLWLGFTGDTTEFQFSFFSKITWNSIFGAANCR